MDDLKEQLRQAEQREAQLRNRVEELSREIEDLSYAISHDLRAPLRAIHGFTRVLQEDYQKQLEGEGERYLGIVMSSARLMSEMIEGMLAISRATKQPMLSVEIPMQRLVEDVVASLQRKFPERNIEFQVGALPNAAGDPGLIEQVWMHLLSNAVKFTQNRENAKVEVNGAPGENEIIYSVRDNGAGFDMKYQAKLFGLFQRFHTEKEFEGIGAGLALVKRIIQRHDGRVWAEAAPGEGATFYFSLPAGQGISS